MLIRIIPLITLDHTWWRHWMETFSASLAFVTGIHQWLVNSPLKRSVTRQMFPFDDVFFDLCLNIRLSIQWQGCWFETLSRSLWRHCNEIGKGRLSKFPTRYNCLNDSFASWVIGEDMVVQLSQWFLRLFLPILFAIKTHGSTLEVLCGIIFSNWTTF